MEIDSKKSIDLNFSILSKPTKTALDFLATQEWLKKDNWYLAGGTALALQTGHRQSVDLDFFTQEKEFDNNVLLGNFIDNKEWEVTINKKNTIYGILFKAKISFIAYPFFIPRQDFVEYGTVKILQPKDIAIMKIIAISQRGAKRDFYDLYWCSKNVESLKELLIKLKSQYPSVAHDYHHILKSLIYFEDAENDPEPEISFKASWKEVKDFFIQEIPKITEEVIKLG